MIWRTEKHTLYRKSSCLFLTYYGLPKFMSSKYGNSLVCAQKNVAPSKTITREENHLRHFISIEASLPWDWNCTQISSNFFISAETDPHEGKRINESLWPVFKIHHQKSRYIYDLYFRRKAISRELYDYCVSEKIADANLIAKWKKSGYENLCCLRCIQTRDTNFGTNCICRVPKAKLEEGRVVECVHCGCRGCSG